MRTKKKSKKYGAKLQMKDLAEARRLVRSAARGNKSALEYTLKRSETDSAFKNRIKRVLEHNQAKGSSKGFRSVNYSTAGMRFPYRK